MTCDKCPRMTLPVQRPPHACKGKTCGKLIEWNMAYCDSCSKSLKKCEWCGDPATK